MLKNTVKIELYTFGYTRTTLCDCASMELRSNGLKGFEVTLDM